MSDLRIAPETFELHPVEKPWRLSLPRSLHGWQSPNDSGGKQVAGDVPGAKVDGKCGIAYVWFVERTQFVAVLSWKDTHEVVKVSGGRVRESVYVNPHQRYFEPRITGLHRKLMAAGLRGFPHEVLKVDLRESDRALAVDVAGFVVRRLTAEPPMRDGRAWLKRQLDGIGEKGGA